MAVASYFDTVQKLYIAFYQRPADAGGLYYWSQVLEANNGNLSAVIDAFATSEEAVRLYDTDGNGMIDNADTSALLDSVFQALFNRAPDAAGKQFYLDALTAGKFPDGRVATVGRVVLDVLNGAQNSDAVAIQNKLEYATAFTKTLDPEQDGIGPFAATYNGEDEAGARMLLAGVTSDPATRKTATQVTVDVRDNIANAGDPVLTQAVAGQNYTLTTDPNNLVGTGGDDNFVAATNNFLQAFDTVAGGAGNDTLVLGGAVGVTDDNYAGVRSVETLRVTNGTANQTYDLGANASTAGINTVNIQGAAQIIATDGFTTGLTINGTAAADRVRVNLANAGTKTLNLGNAAAARDIVEVTPVAAADAAAVTAAVGSVQVNFLSGGVGNSTDQNVTIKGQNGNVIVNDENVQINNTATGNLTNVNIFNVVGLAADGTVDAAQNRGNFANIVLGGTAADTVATTGIGGAVYINGGAGNDVLTANSAGNHFLVGGAGNDSLTINANGNTSVIAGGGDDLVFVTTNGTGNNSIALTSGTNVLTMANGTLRGTIPALADTLVGGADADTLRITDTDATAYLTPTTRSISGFETLALTTNLQGIALTVANIQQGINAVTLEAGATGGSTLNLEAGAKTVNIGTAANTALSLAAGGALAGSLTVAAAGTATTDALTLTVANGTVSTNALGNQAVKATGYESVTINTGATGTGAVAQTINTLTVRGAQGAAEGGGAADNSDALSLTLLGSKAITINALEANTDGILTVDASGMTAQATGTTTLRLNGADVRDNTAESTLVIGAINLTGTAGDDSITGSGGNDTIAGGLGNNFIAGGAGNDVISVTGGISNISGNDGNDTITAVLGVNAANDVSTVTGNAGNDTITLTGDGRVNADGGADNDTITLSGNGNATMVAGAGNDQITVVGNGNLTVNLTGGGSNQVTIQGTGTKNISGGADVDVVSIVGTGNATVDGGASADIISVGAGASTVIGGAGGDTIELSAASAAVNRMEYGALVADVGAEGGDSITGFTAGTVRDVLAFNALALNYNLGDNNATIVSVVAAGAVGVAGSELVIDTTAKVDLAAVQANLAMQVGNVTATKGALLVAGDANNTYVFHDANGSTAGGVTLVATLVGVNVANVTADNFAFFN